MQGISPTLAERIARQAAIKLDESELTAHAVWIAVGELLRKDFDQLRTHLGLADRQIVGVLPKLSARQVESFFKELVTKDRKIARTILDAAFDAADPISTGRRFLDEYHHIAEQLDAIDPRMARTLANATFTVRAPHNKAVELLKHFSDLSSHSANARWLETFSQDLSTGSRRRACGTRVLGTDCAERPPSVDETTR
jgi:hypothetical protein